MNLQGAHGLLINVTAGMDLRTSEFSIVGDTVKQYASEDANVVVGCVIDPEMREEIRVTVVATGIGRPARKCSSRSRIRRRMTAIAGGRGGACRRWTICTCRRTSATSAIRMLRSRAGQWVTA